MTMINPTTGWFELVKVPMYDLNELIGSNYEYIDKSYARVRHLFNNIWLSIYPHPRKVVFDNGYEFKQYFTPMIKYLNNEPVLTTFKHPQANTPVERLHQVRLNMLVAKDTSNKLFDYIYLWGETLAYIAWAIRASYHHILQVTPGQDFFGRYIIFNLPAFIYWRVITSGKQQQVDIDNF